MCESATVHVATVHRTSGTSDQAMADLDLLALELVELVQAKTGRQAEAECKGNTIRAVVRGGKAVGAIPPWNVRSLDRCDPTRLEIRWELRKGPVGVELRALFWLLPEGTKDHVETR